MFILSIIGSTKNLFVKKSVASVRQVLKVAILKTITGVFSVYPTMNTHSTTSSNLTVSMLTENDTIQDWISVKTRLPEPVDQGDEFSEMVLVNYIDSQGNRKISSGYTDFDPQGNEWYIKDIPLNEEFEVTHWKLLRD